MTQLGFEPDRLAVTGIPAHPKFAVRHDKQTMRIKHGLHPEMQTVLVSAGGFGVGPVQHLLQSLSGLARCQIVVVCGRNDELRDALELSISGDPDSFRFWKVVGYTTEMNELMDAADVIVGKPGGLTAAEAMIKGLAFVIVNPIPGQEERNADHLIEQGAAIRCNNLPVLPFKLTRLLDNTQQLATLQRNARQLARPHAAIDIARQASDLLRSPMRSLACSPPGHVCLTKSELVFKRAKEVATQILGLAAESED